MRRLSSVTLGLGAAAIAGLGGLAAPASGAGIFRAAHTYRTGATVFGVAVADMNRDGKPDILAGGDVAAGSPKNHISYFRGRGDGTFKKAIKIPDGNGAEGIVVGRFNGDKIPDFAVADYETNEIGIWLGSKGGMFHRSRTLDDPAGPWLLQSADLNGDGHPDLVAGNYNGTAATAMTVFLSKKSGGFKAGTDYAAPGSNTDGIALAKLSPDKRPDVVMSRTGQISYFKGKAGGTFGSPVTNFDLTTEPGFLGMGYGVAAGEFDTPNPDAAVPVEQSGGGEVFPIRDPGAPGLIITGTPTPVPDTPSGIAAGDFNRDGVDDVAVGRAAASESGFDLLISKNDLGEFSLGANGTYEGSAPAQWVASGRVNGDRAPDVIVGTGTGIDVYINKN